MSKKKLTGFGRFCAGGQDGYNDGSQAVKVGQPGAPLYKCVWCEREFKMVNGKIPQHVWQPKNPDVDVLDRSTNSQANLARRAFERTR